MAENRNAGGSHPSVLESPEQTETQISRIIQTRRIFPRHTGVDTPDPPELSATIVMHSQTTGTNYLSRIGTMWQPVRVVILGGKFSHFTRKQV